MLRLRAGCATVSRIFFFLSQPIGLYQGMAEPGASVSPIAVGTSAADPEDVGGLGERQPSERAELHQLGCPGVLASQIRERLVEGQQLITWRIDEDSVEVDSHAPPAAAALQALSVSGPIDQDSAHRLGCRGEEMPPPIEWAVRVGANKPQIGLMYERRGLERLAVGLVLQSGRSELA